MLAGIRDILIITTPSDQESFQKLLGTGNSWGIDITYEVQEKPEGLAQAFIIGKDFIGSESVALILGDNIFHGSGLGRELTKCSDPDGALIFGYEVSDAQRYGVAEIDSQGNIISLQEKPTNPKSNLAIPGLYFFDKDVSGKASRVLKSDRGELEIISILEDYQREKKLRLKVLPRGTAWMDCGTNDALNDACNYVRAIEERQGFKIGSIEEIAWRNGWITSHELQLLATIFGTSQYGNYLRQISSRNEI